MQEEKTKNIEIYDLEIFVNLFTYTGINKQTNEVKQFRIGIGQNDLSDLLCHLLSLSAMIGFNNLNYDYPILHFLITNAKELNKLTNDEITYKIYLKSQEIINSEYSEIRGKDVKIPQVDLYRIHHFDNKAKRTSLKDLEIVMGFEKVEDLPYSYNHTVAENEVEKILEYNLNDVKATLMFYIKSLEAIKLRQELGKEFDLSLINFNDPKIGAEIFAKIISEEEDISIYDLKQLRTNRKFINLGECILPIIKYKSKEFNKILNKLKNTTITQTKGAFEESVIYHGFKYDFGTGGIHGCTSPGVYIPSENEVIKTCDVTSLYPSLAIQNNFYPEHLGESFVRIYERVFNKRNEAKKTASYHKNLGLNDTKNNAINEGLKLALNGVYGKSNDQYSFFFDPKFTMQITINGQLLLTMLAEQLADAGFKVLMINTDGIECIVNKDNILIYHSICAEWQRLTKLNLEFDEYKKMIIRDVNNYIAVYKNNKVKYKGTFEIDKLFHKDPSNKILRIALSRYFVDGISVSETIRNHTNILDFCKRFKATQGWHSELRTVNKDAILNVIKLQKTNRYFISNKGGTYLKVHEDERVEQIEAGWLSTIMNTYDKDLWMSDYNINYEYYIIECNKIINVIENKQLNLF